MGTRYNVSHVSEAAVKEAWANYSKYDYYYNTEIAKAQESLAEQTSSAKAQLAAKGIFETDTKYQAELDRITNIAQADIASLTKGQQSLQGGAIKKLLTEAPITKYSTGNYTAYLGTVAREMDKSIAPVVYRGREVASQDTWGYNLRTGQYELTSYGEEGAEITERKSIEEAGAKSFQDYYTGIYGAYDATAEIKQEKERTAEESARGKAGSRAYNIQSQPKGQPGGGKPGNVFMQTPQEVAQDQAPQDEQRKAWWM